MIRIGTAGTPLRVTKTLIIWMLKITSYDWLIDIRRGKTRISPKYREDLNLRILSGLAFILKKVIKTMPINSIMG